MYEAVKALITEISLIRFDVIAIQQNYILLPTFVLYKVPLLAGAVQFGHVKLKTLLW